MHKTSLAYLLALAMLVAASAMMSSVAAAQAPAPALRRRRRSRLRGLLFARKNLNPEIDEPRSHRRIGQCLHRRSIKPPDDVPWRDPGREKPEPSGD
jgi:hypothetical protein